MLFYVLLISDRSTCIEEIRKTGDVTAIELIK